jgi:hypothetical protein
MPKNTNTQGTQIIDDAQDNTENHTNMDNIHTSTPDAVALALPVAGKAVLTSNDAKTSYRLTWMREGRAWDSNKDLSLLDFSQGTTGLNAIAKYVAGDVKGIPTLIEVAPEDKLEREFGTGVFAYVSSDHKPEDAIEIDLNGKTLSLYVNEQDIPKDGWNKLKLNGGELYHEPKDPTYTVRGERGGWLDTEGAKPEPSASYKKHIQETSMYWRLKTFQAILAGRNVSVSVGPWMLDTAKEVAAVASSEDPKAANDLRLFLGRRTRRDVKQVAEATEVVRATLEGNESNLVASEDDFMVPSVSGQMVSLKTWPKGQPLQWQDAQGLVGRPRFLKVGDSVERMQFARMIVQNGYKLLS